VLFNHLQRHQGISSRLSTPILRRYKHLPVAQEDSDIVSPPNDSRALPFLAAPVWGYSCPHCILLTVNWGEFRKHLNKIHNVRKIKIHREDGLDFVCLLALGISHPVWNAQYRLNLCQALDLTTITTGILLNVGQPLSLSFQQVFIFERLQLTCFQLVPKPYHVLESKQIDYVIRSESTNRSK
jgi:hypothetical protein